MSYTVSLFHIVFGTYRRSRVLDQAVKEEFNKYIGGILKNYKSKLLCANYVSNHVHLLINLSVEEPLSKVVGAIKQSTSLWLKNDRRSPYFEKWSKEYYAVSLSPTHMGAVKGYILDQQNHHSRITFDEELDQLISKAGLQRYPDTFYE